MAPLSIGLPILSEATRISKQRILIPPIICDFSPQLSTLSVSLPLPSAAEWLALFLEDPVRISNERSVVVTEAYVPFLSPS